MYEFPLFKANLPCFVADWIELTICSNKFGLSKEEVISYMEFEILGEIGEDEESSFGLIDDVWNEMKKRLVLYGDNPPFGIHKNKVESKIDWNKNPEYLACLILSVFGNKDTSGQIAKLFEILSAEAIRRYINGKSIVHGFPSEQTIPEIVRNINEKENPNFKPLPKSKDDGLDSITWLPVGDGRPGQVIILLQSASGKDWKSKLGELSLELWGSFIIFGCPPIRGFSIPSIITKAEDFLYFSKRGGLFFDRCRIYKHTYSSELKEGLREKLRKWCIKTILEYNN